MRDAPLAFGPFVLDRTNRRLSRDGAEIALQPRAFELLRALAERPGEIVSPSDLIAAAWPDERIGENAVAQMVRRVRVALGDTERPHVYVEALPKRGYRLLAAVQAGPARAWPVGREAACEAILSRLRDADLAVVGMAGMGKTTVLRAIATAWPGEVVWVDATRAADRPSLVLAVAMALGVGRGPSIDDASVAIGRAAARRAMLVVVDGADSLAGLIEPHVREWAGRARWLVGSRHRLDMPAFTLDPLDPGAASALFERIAGELPAVERTKIPTLCARLDLHPLSIVLAAGQASVVPPTAMLRRLGRRFELLRGTDAGREATLAELLADAIGAVGSPASHVLHRLAVFEGGFDLDDAEAVVGESAADGLRKLVAHHLVWIESAGRFVLPESVRAWVEPMLAADPEREQVVRRLAERITADAEARFAAWDAVPLAEQLAELDAVVPAVIALHRRAAGLFPEQVGRAITAVAPALNARGPLDRACELLIFAFVHTPDRHRGLLADRVRWTSTATGRVPEVADLLIAATAADPEQQIYERAVGWYLRVMRNDGRGFADLESAAQQVRHPGRFVNLNTLHAEALAFSNRREEAATAASRALSWCEGGQMLLHRIRALQAVANLRRMAGQPAEARALASEAARLLEPTGNPGLTASLKINLANVLDDLGESAAARIQLDEARAFAIEAGDRSVETVALGNAALVAARSDLPLAVSLLHQALGIHRDGLKTRYRAWLLLHLGKFMRVQGMKVEAAPVLERCLALLREASLTLYELEARVELFCARPDAALLEGLVPTSETERGLIAMALAYDALHRGDRAAAQAHSETIRRELGASRAMDIERAALDAEISAS